jgi:putative transposase
MNSGSSTLNMFAHNIGQNWYHLVLIPKYRNPVFRQKHQHDLMEQAILWICKRHSIDLFAKEVMDDHVHLFVSCPPHFSVRRMIQTIKGGTSYYIRYKHPPLKYYKTFWSRGAMYRSVGAVNADVVKRYIGNSNHWLPPGQKKLN